MASKYAGLFGNVGRVSFWFWLAATIYALLLCASLVEPHFAFNGDFRFKVKAAIAIQWLATLAFGGTLLFASSSRSHICSLLMLMATVALAIALPLAISNYAPLKSAFALCKPSLLAIATSDEQQRQAGLYRIEGILRMQECCIIFTRGDVESHRACGFVKMLEPEKPATSRNTELRLACFYELGDGWFAFYSYYDFVKRGWS